MTLIPLDGSRVPADQNPVLVYLGSLQAQRSRDTMIQALDVIADIIAPDLGAVRLGAGWGQLRYQHTMAIRAALSQRFAPGTTNKILSALRGVLKECWRLGYMTAEEYQRAVDFKNLSDRHLPTGRDYTIGEVRSMIAVCMEDETPSGPRDAAIIGILWSGLRRAEVSALDVGDYDAESGKIRVRHGKGDKARDTFLDGGTCDALADWLALRGHAEGALFWPVNKGGGLKEKRLSAQAIYYMVDRRGKAVGIMDARPHNFRRTAVGDLLTEGVDISTVARMMGHSNVETTAQYDRRKEEIKKQAANTRRLPYVRRKGE
jgi:integrase